MPGGPNIAQADDDIPDNLFTDEAFERLSALNRDKTTAASRSMQTLRQNTGTLNRDQLQVESKMSEAILVSNVDSLSSDLAASAMNTSPNNTGKQPNHHALMLLLKPEISTSITEHIDTYQIPYFRLSYNNAREKFIYHIADCIRHGSKLNNLRFYQGPVDEAGLNKIVSLVGNTGRLIFGNRKTYFWKPIINPAKIGQVQALTREAVHWTIDKHIGFDLYMMRQDRIPQGNLESIRANLPLLVLNNQQQPVELIIIKHNGNIKSKNPFPIDNPAGQLNLFIRQYYDDQTQNSHGYLEADDPILTWLIKIGHTPAKKSPPRPIGA